MRFGTFGALVAATILTVGASANETRFADEAQAANLDEYAKSELQQGDWSEAEAALLGADVAPEDQVFAKLNLAFVYSTTGRKEQAVAMYREILDGRDNPYALLMNGEPRRVKTIAKTALARMGEN
jgi:Tfp pilus assembly protein PilF